MSMNIRFDNKVAVVTGGTAGIGLACAQLFGQLGAKVAICGTNPAKLAAALEKLKAAESAALAAPQTAEPTADVTAEEESLPATDTSVLAAAVTTDALSIRRSGDWDAEALALVDYGTTVAVTGKSGGWYQVRYDGIEGYLSGEYLDLRTSGLTGYGQVTADALNLRSGAGTGYETVTSLPNGAWVSVSRFENGWFYVDYDGVSGYVSGD